MRVLEHELARHDANRAGDRARLARRSRAPARRCSTRPRPRRRPSRRSAGLTSRVSISSRHMTSEAIADPPGLSMRTTIARMDGSMRTLRTHASNVSEPSDLAARRIERALAARDRADRVEQRDARSGADRARTTRSRAGRCRRRSGASPAPAARRRSDLRSRAHRRARPSSLPRPGYGPVDRLAHVGVRLLAALGDRVDELVEPVLVERARSSRGAPA